MIAMLSGRLLEKQLPVITLEAGGVGYEVELPLTSFMTLPDVGEQTTLFTHLVVRENAHLLYGFGDRMDRDLFRILIGVSGVGPKLGLVVLSGMKAMEFIRCIDEQDIDTMIQLPGLGRKIAHRLVVEVRDRLPAQMDQGKSPGLPGGQLINRQAATALESLGYPARQASAVVKSVNTGNMTLEDLVTAALKRLAN